MTSHRLFGFSSAALGLCASGAWAACLLFAFAATHASTVRLEEDDISGRVLLPSGAPAAEALITLTSSTFTQRIRADEKGHFTFRNPAAGEYIVTAEDAQKHIASAKVIATAGVNASILLALGGTEKTSSTQDESLTFSDAPNFVVSGVTDWTASGGHGSSAATHTRENLVHETTNLRTEGSQGRPDEPFEERQLERAVSASSNNPVAYLNLGRYYLRSGAWQQATKSLSEAAKYDPSNAQVHYSLALAYFELGDYANASLHTQSALLGATRSDVHLLAGKLAEKQGDAYSAVQHMQRAVQMESSEEGYFTWASELLVHRATREATNVFERGVIAYPASSRMHAGLGSALFADGKYASAAMHMCKAVDLKPDDTRLHLLLGEIDESSPVPLACPQEWQSRFYQSQPQNADANYLYAISLLRHDKDERSRAAVLLRKAIQLRPAYAEAYLRLGNLAAEEKRNEESVECYKEAVAIDNSLIEAHFRLSVAYQKMRQDEPAKLERETYERLKRVQAEQVAEEHRLLKQFVVSTGGHPAN